MSDAKVIFDYDAEADDELTLKEGDVIRDIEKKEDGWWEGELHGRRGMFPENFVQEIKKSAPDLRQEKAEKPFASKEKTTVAKVTFDYKAENDDELTLNEGDMVKVLSLVEEGWWKGELNGKVGVFPANFVEVVKGPIPPATDVEPVGAEPSLKEPAEKADSPEKKAKIVGGMGFGGLLTQDALSGIKLRKSTSNTNANPNHKAGKSEEPSELSKRMSMKRHPPKVPEPEKAPKSTSKPKERVLVEFDYDGEQSDELTLHKGEIVYVIEKDVSEGWSKGELNGNIGLFPDNFVTPLPPVDPQKDADMNRDRDKSSELPNKKPLMGEDLVDAKQSRPEFPFPSLKKTAERPPPPKQPSDSSHSEFPVNLKPVPKPPEETSKQQETSMSESKQEEKPPKFQVKPAKRSPPLLPKKPDKPDKPEKPEKPDKPDKPKIPPDLPLAKGPQQSPPSSRKPPPAVSRHLNGPDKDPSKRLSAITPGEVSHHEAKFKRHSQGAEISVDLNDIKPSAVLQPLTADRPKNTARKPPTKYDKPLSPKKINTPEKTNDAEWPKVKEEKEEKKPAIEKPKKPAAPESSRSKISSGPTLDTSVMKNMQDEINTLKQSLTSITKEFKEHVRATENRFKKMEKKLLDEVEDLTKELDEEKKARSAVDVEVNRLRKLIRNQTTS